jgi:diadenosine tetraphosphate (Ap4A) HIT family hydrolase
MVTVGGALEGVYAALKINYAILGNNVPHLHAHIQPRYGQGHPASRRMRHQYKCSIKRLRRGARCRRTERGTELLFDRKDRLPFASVSALKR